MKRNEWERMIFPIVYYRSTPGMLNSTKERHALPIYFTLRLIATYELSVVQGQSWSVTPNS